MKEKASIKFCRIWSARMLETGNYPIFTMVFQALASIVVCLECIFAFAPDIYCDTIGAAFTFPVVRIICGCPVIAYVHYPMISMDMLQLVQEKRPTYNNMNAVASNHTISYLKLLYYRFFAFTYGIVGSFANEVMVNSTWTRNHIENLWTNRSSCSRILSKVGIINGSRIETIYPPCNVATLCKLEIGKRFRAILSVGQFRPEKNHSLQLRVFKTLYERDPEKYKNVVLLIVGSCRNYEDILLVERLRKEIANLSIPKKNVVFKINVSFAELRSFYAHCAIGLHTMWNEHFGISLVEMMAAGLAVVAHKSGGPRDDIIDVSSEVHRTGYLATSPDEYANAIEGLLDTLELRELSEIDNYNLHDVDDSKLFQDKVICDGNNRLSVEPLALQSPTSDFEPRLKIRERARVSTEKFSDEVFASKIVSIFSKFYL